VLGNAGEDDRTINLAVSGAVQRTTAYSPSRPDERQLPRRPGDANARIACRVLFELTQGSCDLDSPDFDPGDSAAVDVPPPLLSITDANRPAVRSAGRTLTACRNTGPSGVSSTGPTWSRWRGSDPPHHAQDRLVVAFAIFGESARHTRHRLPRRPSVRSRRINPAGSVWQPGNEANRVEAHDLGFSRSRRRKSGSGGSSRRSGKQFPVLRAPQVDRRPFSRNAPFSTRNRGSTADRLFVKVGEFPRDADRHPVQE